MGHFPRSLDNLVFKIEAFNSNLLRRWQIYGGGKKIEERAKRQDL